MIFRRPYAFLIRHFRLIHLIMFAMLEYSTVMAKKIFDFFRDYITYSGKIEVISSNYNSYYIYIGFILVMILSTIIYFLMKYKSKPRLFYIGIIILCVFSSILFIFSYFNIRGLESTSVSGRELRLYRDISTINYGILIIMSIPMLIRGLGFDIKKFNFTSDLKELNLNEEDSAEVEVYNVLNSNAFKRNGRKLIREFSYYYKDNSLIINIFLVIATIILVFVFPVNRYIINRDLSEGEILNTKDFNLKVNCSYISERNRISKDNSYVIIKVSIIGKTNKYSLDLDEFVLNSKNDEYFPSMKYYNYFTDVGIGYKGGYLDINEYKEYLLIYNINSIDADNDFKLEYLNSKKKVKLNLKKID